MKNFAATTNIANKVRNTRLPRTKPLMPLFEVISNSIHSIEEAKTLNYLKDNQGTIIVIPIRNGDESTLKNLEEIDYYPIHSFKITDNGIGLNDENLNSFIEADTDHKIEIGGKGIGRFVCLKAFKELKVDSDYLGGSKKMYNISFNFKPTKEGFHDIKKLPSLSEYSGTTIVLGGFNSEYQKNVNFSIYSIAREIISHFQLYFIRKQAPEIIIRNQNNFEYKLANLFAKEFKDEVQQREFFINDEFFTLYLTKSLKIQSHKIHFCAHNRSVITEGLYSKILDLGKRPIKDDEDNGFYYEAYIVGKILDDFVDTERIGFNFPDEVDLENEESQDLNLATIRKSAINCIEELLNEYLFNVRNHKIDSYRPLIMSEMPQYRSTLKFKKDEVMRLPPDLSKDELDIELYKIELQWRLEVKEEKKKLMDDKKDITNYDTYTKKYEKFITQFNEIGQSDLARYVVHRKTTIDLLENLIESNCDNKFENEDLIHSIFFPIRTTSDEITPDKQNLWLIDERLTYHSFLSSDKTFKSIEQIDSNNTDRTDLLIFNEAFAFSDSKSSPHNSFTIVEFKKPMRDNYKDYDDEKNPIEQAERYIENLLDKNVKGRNGRNVEVMEKTPFYIYIICDIMPSFERILKNREFEKTPDGKGYFKVKSKYYSAYFEVLPFEKVLEDAKKRNRILFEKLIID